MISFSHPNKPILNFVSEPRHNIKRPLIFQGSFLFLSTTVFRAVAQPGSVQRSGRWGRWFESSLPDW